MFDTLYAQIGLALTVVVVAFALLKGDQPERVGAAAYALGLFASVVVQDDRHLTGPRWGLMAIDVAMLAIYVALAWKSRRAWPVWAGALQTLIVMIHILTLIDARPPLRAFYAVMNLASLGILLATAAGTVRAWRDRRAAGLE